MMDSWGPRSARRRLDSSRPSSPLSFAELVPSTTARVGLLRRVGSDAHQVSSSGSTTRAAAVPGSGVARGALRGLDLRVRAGCVLPRLFDLGGVTSASTLL